jgi:hypothetical protein
MILDQDFSFCLFSRIKDPDFCDLSAVIAAATTAAATISSAVSAASAITTVTTTAAFATIYGVLRRVLRLRDDLLQRLQRLRRSQFTLGEYLDP